jgi:hypothetical protein
VPGWQCALAKVKILPSSRQEHIYFLDAREEMRGQTSEFEDSATTLPQPRQTVYK